MNDQVNHLVAAWDSVLLLVQLIVGVLMGWGVRILRDMRTEMARIRDEVRDVGDELRKVNGRLGRLEQRVADHDKLDDERHAHERADLTALWARVSRLTQVGGGK